MSPYWQFLLMTVVVVGVVAAALLVAVTMFSSRGSRREDLEGGWGDGE